MQLLYKGQYQNRYVKLIPLLKAKNVTELCFGDIVIADFCKKNNIHWIGYDVNGPFVKNAVKNNFNAHQMDILKSKKFETADICLIIGSLYHFHLSLEILLQKMFDCAPILLISEPIKNLSQSKGIIGKLAKGASDVNNQAQNFRFNELTLTNVLTELSIKLNFKIEVIEKFNKDIIIRLSK